MYQIPRRPVAGTNYTSENDSSVYTDCSWASGVSKICRQPPPLRHRWSSKPPSYSEIVRHTAPYGPDTSLVFSKHVDSMTRTSVASPFQHLYAQLEPGEIRLLSLSPSEAQDAPICGSLIHAKLTQKPLAYTAISYAWGDRRHMSSIRISGETVSVTTSLWHALAALRKADQESLIWADALSINQHDIEELNYQVQIMDTIYNKAERVAICLGPHSEDGTSKLAFPYLREISNPTCPSQMDYIASKEQISSVVRLFERSYWKRLWILQEVFYAKKVEVFCGPDSISLDDISYACRHFELNSHRIERSFPGGIAFHNSPNHYSYAQTLTTQGPNALLTPLTFLHAMSKPLHILRLCRNKLVSRPQDKILGVLSLFPQKFRSLFRPDFHHTPQEVFKDLVSCVVTGARDEPYNLDIICESIRYPFHRDSFGLPSWVPDWSHAPDTLSLAATHLSHREPFQAWPWVVGKSNPSKTLPSFDRDTLQILGFQIGTITARGMAVGTLGRLSNYLMAFLEWRNLLLDEFDNGRDEKAAFCRTLCLGDVPYNVCKTLSIRYGSKWSPSIELDPYDYSNLWQQVTFDQFARYLGERLGKLPLDAELQLHQKAGHTFPRGRQFLQDYFGDRMMGRCFCILRDEGGKGHMGMGTGYMGIDDIVVVAYGCSTPIVLRPADRQGEYEFIGDIYVDGFMDGEVLKPGYSGLAKKFVLR